MINLVAILSAVLIRKLLLNPVQPVPKSAAVLITGCSTGIGFDTACAFSKQGFHVFATVRKDADKAKLETFAKANNATLSVLMMDVTDKDSVAAAVEELKKDLESKKLTLLSVVNNAGYAEVGPVEMMPAAAVSKQFDTNVFGLIQVTNACLPLLRAAREGVKQASAGKLLPSVVLLSSVVGKLSLAGMSIYCASKFAVEAVADGYRQELAGFGVNVVCVEPGAIRTNFMDTSLATAAANAPADVQAEQPPADTAETSVPAAYAHKMHLLMQDSNDMVGKTAQPSSMVTAVLREAILSPKPLARYRAGRDANLMVSFRAWLPDALFDAVTNKRFK
jgi:NAD(P)-dependent dehydrogenase (short-subunit alcohol dehydrogenase family)